MVEWDGAERDSAGTVVVENYGTPLWGDADLWTFEEVLRIGMADGDPDYQFGSISAIAVLSDRRVVVADQFGHHLRFFSADGNHEMTIGRAGEGPGEFGSGFLGLMVAQGDTLVVVDARNAQAHAIAPDGSYQGSFSILPQDGFSFRDFDSDPPNRMVTVHAPLSPATGEPGDTMDVMLERDIRGAVLDTVDWVPSSRATSGQGETRLRHFYRGVPDGALCNGGNWSGRSDKFLLNWHSPDSRPDRRVTVARERLTFDERDEAALLARFDALMQERQVPSAEAAAFKSRIRFEDRYPAFRRTVCGPAGTLLVQRVRPLRDIDQAEWPMLASPTNSRPPGSRQWDVLDPDGRLLGSITAVWDGVYRAPRFVRDARTGSWYVYDVMRDELDVEYVVGWRIDGRMPS